ncbi:RagB/SusD family nutrient uptake outer membrane protein [Chitinophaga polysaccharea]|uniref:RagB/SusD family nutrient uptake outer membrane protein n=1 Tax=Chitinophaga polysaccharea TaxID=1293035 RepID=UPI0014552773|nr:RagB/SusD family nutrient uptake outer membrane protein [Chitinophaga polysaccharea]NLR56849.1 RagB/SusD family nutrient uptake outer membrane protein [Chitinophaga polysaccharea]
MQTKNNLQYLLGGLLLLLAHTSCNKLTENPYSSIFTENFYKTASDAEAALTAVYGPMVNLYLTAATGASDFSADQTYPRPVVGRDTYTLFSYDPNYTTQKSFNRQNESPQQIWQSCYAGIEKANWVLYKVPQTNMDSARRSVILGEACYMRAFYLWMLTKNFRDIVVKTTPSTNIDTAIVGKTLQADVYKQIYLDLDQAIAKLPTYSGNIQKGRPSKEVATALYAKAALYIQDWPTALDKAKQVLNSGKYSLMPDVVDVYNVAKEDLARQENMWAFECESTSPGFSTQIIGLYGPKNSDGPQYAATSYGSTFAYQSFFDSFDPADRRRLLLDTFYINKLGKVVHQKDITPITPHGVLVKKYMDPNSIGGSGAVNIPILRLADVYLIAAEASAQQNGPSGEAYGYINAVRTRAGLPGLTTGLGKAAFVDAVLQERSWELFAEGDRWYDLTRTNTFLQVIPLAVNDVFPTRTPQAKNRYFPIPLDEINANPKLAQNPDWK